MNLNIAPSPFDEDQDQDHNPRGFSCQLFFDSTDRDRTKFYNNHHQFYPEDDCYSRSYHGGSPYDDDTDDKVHSSLKLTLWSDPVKWMKPNSMRETKTNYVDEDRLALKITTGGGRNKLEVREEDQKLRPSSSLETDHFSSINSSFTTIRVCSDCNTTKTPLWRSGPKGPKSLCNACGIRQRKARRAMAVAAAAAAAAAGMGGAVDRPPPVLKIKVQQQNKQKMRHGQDSKFKKRSKISTATADRSSSSSSVPKKLEFEDFLIKMNKNSSFQRVFPQDEKDAAILLMALSSGLVHG